ncbi:MAG: discoidin domain-containing protein, partial [Chloroflexota bacterium]|nr:discoidin domain-containing protein [Chloroflexota bacterium]
VARDGTSYVADPALDPGSYAWRVTALLADGGDIVSDTWIFTVLPESTATADPTATGTATAEPPAEPPTVTSTTEASSTVTVTSTMTDAPTATPTATGTTPPTATPTAPNPTAITPTRTPQPTAVTRSELSGSQTPGGYRLTGAGRSAGAVHPSVLTDGDRGTIWTSPATTPGSAYFVLSLDSVQPLGEIRWLVGKGGHADQIRISVSTDRASWTEVGRARNATVGEWQALNVSVKARYVRFIFVNIRGDRWLGGLVEVEVHAPEAKPTPTPTTTVPTPVADGIVRNASLEKGTTGWYLESGVRVSTSKPRGGARSLAVTSAGGYADQRISLTPGKSYQLTIWGVMTRPYDLAMAGVVFRDRNGTRLSDLEPDRLEFTGTRYTRLEVQFTVPNGVATSNIYIWKEAGGAGFFADDIQVRQIAGIADGESGTPVTCQGLMVPGYFDPTTTSLWQKTTATGSGVALVIVNPNSGVGSRYDSVWSEVVHDSLEAGFRVLGYVQTDYGTRSPSAVIEEMNQYRRWYGVKDFFLDEADTAYASVDRYRTMVRDVHKGGGIAVLNFGWIPHHAYMEFTDVAGVFEASYELYGDAYERPSWFYNYPPERFLHIVHSTPTREWRTVVQRSRDRNAGYVWVTDDAIVSYYKSLPTFWTDLNKVVTAGC